jgi:hypothetical protein
VSERFHQELARPPPIPDRCGTPSRTSVDAISPSDRSRNGVRDGAVRAVRHRRRFGMRGRKGRESGRTGRVQHANVASRISFGTQCRLLGRHLLPGRSPVARQIGRPRTRRPLRRRETHPHRRSLGPDSLLDKGSSDPRRGPAGMAQGFTAGPPSSRPHLWAAFRFARELRRWRARPRRGATRSSVRAVSGPAVDGLGRRVGPRRSATGEPRGAFQSARLEIAQPPRTRVKGRLEGARHRGAVTA